MIDLFNKALRGPFDRGCKETDTEYRILHFNDGIEIYFQGSTSKRDWIENFRFWAKMYKRMTFPFYVHAGFKKKYHSIRDELLEEIREIHPPQIVVAGYSQGAAMATLAYEDIRWHFPGLYVIGYAFGSPRVLWAPSFEIVDRWRWFLHFRNGDDAVTKLPPVALGYWHVGMQEQLGKRHWWRFSIKDHFGNAYRRALS